MTDKEIQALDTEAFITFAESCDAGCKRNCEECHASLIRKERLDRIVYELYRHAFTVKLSLRIRVLSTP